MTDTDLDGMSREQLASEVRRLRAGIRAHRDSSAHDLCWHQPELWGLLPEPGDRLPVVPDWPQFLRGCVRYRESLDRQAAAAPRTAEEYPDGGRGGGSAAPAEGPRGLQTAPRPAVRPAVVRPATADDRPFVLATASRLADFTLPEWRRAGDVVAAEVAALAAAFADGRHVTDLFVAAAEDGQPLGFLFLERPVDYFTGRPHGHVSTLAVVPAAEGRGVGSALMAKAEEWARGHGFPLLTLNVFAGNYRARALYERLGYGPDTLRYLKPL